MQEQEKELHLLWIEPSRFFFHSLESHISSLQVTITYVENASQGIMKSAQQAYQCIVFEKDNSDISAEEFIHDVREFLPEVRIILLSLEFNKSEVIKYLRMQVHDVIERSDTAIYLMRVIAKALHSFQKPKYSISFQAPLPINENIPFDQKNILEKTQTASNDNTKPESKSDTNFPLKEFPPKELPSNSNTLNVHESAINEAQKNIPPEIGNTLLRDSITFLRDKLRNGQMQLPTMPSVAKEVLSIIGKENIGPHHIIPILERDQHITSKVIKLANTAHHRRVNKIANIHDAIIRLGHKTVFNIVQTVSHRGFFKLKSLAYQEIMENLWENTIATAFIARNIAYGLGIKNAEDVYLAALFVNVGEPFLVRVVAGTPEISSKIQNDLQQLTTLFDKCHTEFGSTLLLSWQFNPFHIAIARHHHANIEKLEILHVEPKNEFIKAVHIINIAGFIAQELGYFYFKNPVMNYFPLGLTFQESIHALGISQTSLKEYTNGVETFVTENHEGL